MSKLTPPNSPLSPTKAVVRRRLPPANPQNRHTYHEESITNELSVGDRVAHDGKSGIVAFIGPTQFAEGLHSF